MAAQPHSTHATGQAKEVAGAANVLVHGADLAQSCVLDELEIGLVPVLLGEGRRLPFRMVVSEP